MPEGVIQFQVEHEERALEPRRYGDLACKLIAWRQILARIALVGQDPARYEGAGYGNLSARVGPRGALPGRRSFLITGTQTSGHTNVDLDAFAVVERYDYRLNRVHSHGRLHPSSESLTHAAIYDQAPHIRCAVHVHAPVLWRRARALGLPTTDPGVPAGTSAMALEVRRLYRETVLSERGILAMGGHEDGILAFGRGAEETGEVLLRWLARAYELACGGV